MLRFFEMLEVQSMVDAQHVPVDSTTDSKLHHGCVYISPEIAEVWQRLPADPMGHAKLHCMHSTRSLLST